MITGKFDSQIMEESQITYLVRGAIFNVFNTLGPGLLESVYVNALCHEFSKHKISFKKELMLPVVYDGERMGNGYRMDILVEEKIIIEVKSVETLLEVHHKQVLTYLKISGLRIGILVNFNVSDIRKGIFRKLNGY